MFKIEVHKAIEAPLLCKKYIEGHVKVLSDFGIQNITSNNNKWVNNPNIYCIIAYDEKNNLVGGIRIQKNGGGFPLPVEEAVGKMDSKVYDMVNYYDIHGGIGELCGLWIANEMRKVGISLVLIRAAISIVNQLNFQTLTGICAEYSLKMFQQVGYVVDHSLGSDGKFIYPNEKYIARVVGILNSLSLSTAEPYDKEIILSLRNKPIQKRKEIGKKGKFEVNYDLYVKIKQPSEK